MNEHRLYQKLSEFVFDWMKKENEKGRQPYQSEIIGALEMVKSDIYSIQSAERILSNELHKMFSKLEGKNIEISKNRVIVVERKEA